MTFYTAEFELLAEVTVEADNFEEGKKKALAAVGALDDHLFIIGSDIDLAFISPNRIVDEAGDVEYY